MLSIVYGVIFLLYAVVLKNLFAIKRSIGYPLGTYSLVHLSPPPPRLLGGILYVVPLSQSLSEGFNTCTYFLYSHIHGLLIDFVVLLL